MSDSRGTPGAEGIVSSARNPLATPAAIALEPAPFPNATAEMQVVASYDDWRQRLSRNLARRSDGRWDPLTHVSADPATERAPVDSKPR